MDANIIMNWRWYSYKIYKGTSFTISTKDTYIHIYTLQDAICLVMQIELRIQRSSDDAIKRINEVLIKQLLNSMKVPKEVPMSSSIVKEEDSLEMSSSIIFVREDLFEMLKRGIIYYWFKVSIWQFMGECAWCFLGGQDKN